MAKFTPTIGLEIHAEVKTETKMFCPCRNDSNTSAPNTNVCPICLAHPGTLPTINKKAVAAVIKLGLALGGKAASVTYFDRKSYFYPDLPKGYQISQYEDPLISNASLNGVKIRRIHLEEDTGRLIHAADGRSSLVDFNRAGVPLLELVTEPDIKNAKEAVDFAKSLHAILRYLDVSDADMEQGQMRIEANVSLAADGKLGTKVELKNINSFKAVYEAINYELQRQEQVLSEGGKLIQETRGWNDAKKITESQRTKESAHDYRYFPEPDLPPFDLSSFDLNSIKQSIPELPQIKKARFIKEFHLPENIVEVLVEDKRGADYFEQAVSELKTFGPKRLPVELLANYLTSDLRGLMAERKISWPDLKVKPEHFAHLVYLIDSGKLSSRLAKNLLVKMTETGEDPENLMKREGMALISDETKLEELAKAVISANPKAVADYKAGKGNAVQFLVGQIMAKTKGQADPKLAAEVIIRLLGKM